MLDRLVADGPELGLQVAAYVNGKLTVNAWAGIADASTGQPVDEDTLFPVYSSTKGVAATIIHILAERGQLSYDEPIASIWPEFAANGKSAITLRHALSHSAGIPQMPTGITAPDLVDWTAMCERVAALTPQWTPGTRIEYHAVTYGWILGEVARRVDGRPFEQMLKEEVADRIGVEAMYCGAPDEVDARIATIVEPEPMMVEDDGLPKAIPHYVTPLGYWMNRPEGRRACIPASTGVMSANAIAKHYAALLPGGVDGVELLPASRIKTATTPQTLEHPENDDYPKNWGLGYQLGGEGSIYGGIDAFGHGGYGGSIGFADPVLGLAVGVTKNHFNALGTTQDIVNELRAHLRR